MKTICTGCSRVLITDEPCDATICRGCHMFVDLLPNITGVVAGHEMVASHFYLPHRRQMAIAKTFEAWTDLLESAFGVTAETIVSEALNEQVELALAGREVG